MQTNAAEAKKKHINITTKVQTNTFLKFCKLTQRNFDVKNIYVIQSPYNKQ